MRHPADLMASDEYKLNLQATALKKAGNLDGAIAALRRRKVLMGVQYTDDKLAKYLQSAGRFDEAMAEIQWLLDQSHAWALDSFGHQPMAVQQHARTMWRGRVHGHAVLICKREGRADLQAEHERLQSACFSLAAELKLPARAAKAARAQAWEDAKAGGPKAMAEFHKAREQERGALGWVQRLLTRFFGQ